MNDDAPLPPQTLADLQAAVAAEELAEFWPRLRPHCQPSIRVLPQTAASVAAAPATAAPLPVGASRLGGVPDLPAEAIWPSWEGRPLSFLAQLNLAELAVFSGTDELPVTGLLSFFYDAQEQPWGYDPADRGRWAVQYHAADTVLAARPLPAGLSTDDYTAFRAVPLAFAAEMTLPNPYEDDIDIMAAEVDQDQQQALFRLHHRHGDGTSRLLGAPDTIQGPVRQQCALASRGLNTGSSAERLNTREALGISEEQAEEWRVHAPAHWLLLLQLDSHEDEAGMMWGDMGRLYFCISREALARRDFGDVWLVLQCF